MNAPRPDAPLAGGEIIDFDEALLAACPPGERARLMTEAAMLAQALAPRGRTTQLEALAQDLQSGVRDLQYGRAHARRLAAALRRMAREARRRIAERRPGS
jgi:hypothetical protein